ncbi:MAG: NfeD family protein [Tepidisphaerales bacterium]
MWLLVSAALAVMLWLTSVVPAPHALARGSEGASVASEGGPAEATAENRQAAVIRIQGVIDDYVKMVLEAHLEEARRRGAGTVIFHLDTPGGVVGATLDLTRMLRNLQDLRTVAFVDPIAYSAGTIFAVACDQIFMSPGAAMGDCAPIAVSPGGVQTLGEAERAKIASPVVADMIASANRNGYDPDMLAAMVLHGRVLHVVKNAETGSKRFVDPETYRRLLGEGYAPLPGVPDPLDGPDTLLTVDNVVAERIGLSRGTFPSLGALADHLGLEIVATLEPTFGQRVVQWLNSATVRGLLVTVFMVTMYLSFNTPGQGLPEAVCLTSLATLVIVPLLTGYASWIELLLILGGIALIALEIFVLTGTLVAGIAGVVSVLLGLVLTFVPRELPTMPGEWAPPSLPSLPGTWSALQTGVIAVSVAMVAALLASWWLSAYLPRLPYARRLVLTGVAGEGGAGSVLGDGGREPWPPVGALAEAVTDLRPSGKAEFPDPDGPGVRTVQVVSDSGFVPKGSRVRVVATEGPTIVVRVVGEGASQQS